ncbi:MAG: restriction endonuclease subunit S [Oscillospiraceae bacterium]|nr:restriction endonuclease subunit S [Oscillospiraceae bacterium]
MVKFQKIKIGSIFDITTPPKRFNANTLTFGGKNRYVARGESNNGIRGYINEDECYLNPANTISFGQDTATMFFQDKPYFTGDKIKVFSLLETQLTRRVALYLISAMKKAFSNFSWGKTSFNIKILKNVELYLPVNLCAEIDFDFMENYIVEIEKKCIEKRKITREKTLNAYLRVSKLKKYILTSKEKDILIKYRNGEVEHRSFKIGGKDGLFDIFTGRDVIISRTDIGDIPLISHQHSNNGITKKIKRLEDRTLFKATETIALADRGIFWASVQAEDFHIGTRVKALVFKNGFQSREVRLFFATAINKLQVLFTAYLSNATDTLPDLEIYLPVTFNGEIDYEYMSHFIHIQEKLSIKNVMDKIDYEIGICQNIIEWNTVKEQEMTKAE